MSDVWVVRNRHGDIVQTYHEEPYEQPDGWTTTRETLLTPEMAAVIAAAKACVTSEEWSEDGMVMYTADMIALADAVEALRAVEGDV
jgi:hypothetical protein